LEDTEYTYYQDIWDKKKTASGARHRASRKKGFKGAVRTPYDFMTRKERKQLSGEVRCYTMPISYTEFKKMKDVRAKIELLEKYLGEFTAKELADLMGTSERNICLMRVRYITGADSHKNRLMKEEAAKLTVQELPIIEETQEIPEAPIKETSCSLPDLSGTEIPDFTIRLNKNGVNGRELKERLLGIASMLMDECDYGVFVDIGEL
jgi:hypothetical protein